MMLRNVLALIACFAFFYNVQCSKNCPSGWSYYSNKCYNIFTTKKTYANAVSDCISKNASLVIPNDVNEYNFLNVYYLPSASFFYHLGIYDYGTNNFSAIDSSAVYFKWCDGEPDNTGSFNGPCVLNDAGCGYRDYPCTERWKYVCEASSCSTDQYYDDTSSSCKNWNSCSSNSDCVTSSNQVCLNGKCSCNTNVWTGSTCESCPTSWTSYGSSCYKEVETSKDYLNALSYCEQQGYGATLAIPNTSQEFSYLKNITADSTTSYFLGVYDYGNKQFSAIDNSTSYLSWCSGEPNNGAKANNPEACVVLKNSGCLNDGYCTSTNYFICEIKK